ncbi:MAG: class I SAM-dependent methyltransferase [Actinomycetota bacterium]|nr:class I SAM-dependent methyltransferase [Actinomycetota bacterium]
MTQGAEGRHDPSLSDALIDYDRVAEVYDLYVAQDFDVAFFVTEAKKTRGKVLELMCGTGRVSLPLIEEAGADLTCVDASGRMLVRLEEKLRERGLKARVVQQDIRRLELPEEEFELALIPFHSFSELLSKGDQELALRATRSCLKEGGRLICPLHDPAIRGRSADGALRLNGTFPTADGGLLVVSGFETLDSSSGVVDRVQLYEFFDASSNLRAKRVLPMRFALIASSEFAELANAAGFVPVALYGDYDRGEYLEGSSPFMIWVLEKPGRH